MRLVGPLLWLAVMAVSLAAPGALAAGPLYSADNDCPGFGGQGAPCTSDNACADFVHATRCASDEASTLGGFCQVPCQTDDLLDPAANPSACAVGETCVVGTSEGFDAQTLHWCKPSQFRMDLNLLDQCIANFLEGLDPVFFDNDCSLEANLTRLLDQNQDAVFDIFDVDLCVLAFMEQPGCDPDTLECEEPDLVGCATDADCGEGLYCGAKSSCQRDCGFITPREESFDTLERECSGPLQVCDFARGRCEVVDVTLATCDADSDCTEGAYCFLGRCAPECYRAADCPDNGWFCTPNNRCRALPSPEAEEGATFDPTRYAVRFGRSDLGLDAVQTEERSALFVMDLITKKQVLDNAALTFGYRLEVTYDLKQDSKCFAAFLDFTDPASFPAVCEDEDSAACLAAQADEQARQLECFIDDTEQWLRIASPFGTVSAVGNPGVEVELDAAIADTLSPGTYTATIRAIFDNGDSDSLTVSYTKTSPSGEYAGALTVYLGTSDDSLTGIKPLTFGMRIKVHEDETLEWDDLICRVGLATDECDDNGDGTFQGQYDDNGFLDETSGQLVTGQLHGQTAFGFTNGAALDAASNEIEFMGIYQPDVGLIRIVGVIEIGGDFCLGPDGECPDESLRGPLDVANPFGRRIRRQLEFFGPFDGTQGRYHGVYTEKISGLVPGEPFTMQGSFELDQIIADDSDLDIELPFAAIVDEAGEVTGMPELNVELAADTAGSILSAAEAEWCDNQTATDEFLNEESFEQYLGAAARTSDAVTPDNPLGRTTIFPDLVQFEDNIQEALTALDTTTVADKQNHLNVYDFISSRLLPCDDTDPDPPPACIDEAAVRCGLALYQKAIVAGWVATDELTGNGTPTDCGDEECPAGGDNVLFCLDTLPVAGCPNEAGDVAEGQAALFALQEHNRFWQDLAQILKFEADRARSDAFLVLFRNEINPFAQGAALAYKDEQLQAGLARYNDLLELIVGPEAASVLWQWPAAAFQSAGRSWIQTMHTVVEDRLGMLAELVDLQRRIFLQTGGQDYVFAQHLMQYEYLTQVWLMKLQLEWEQEEFGYAGDASAAFDIGQGVLNQLNPAKNAIGVTGGQVFFENAGFYTSNWENYRDILVGDDGDGGLIADARDLTAGAVENLQSALADLDALEETLQGSKFALEDQLWDMCGDSEPWNPDSEVDTPCQRALKNYDALVDFVNTRACVIDGGAACDDSYYYSEKFDIECELEHADESKTCADLKADFGAFTDPYFTPDNAPDGEPGLPGLICSLDVDLEQSATFVEVNGQNVPCVGGQMGDLLQQRALLVKARLGIFADFEKALKDMEAIATFANAAHGEQQTQYDTFASLKAVRNVMAFSAFLAGDGAKIAKPGAQAAKCILITGFAFGTDCFGGAVSAALQAFVVSVFGTVAAALDNGVDIFDASIDGEALKSDLEQFDDEQQLAMTQAYFEVYPMAGAIELQSQEIFNLTAQIDSLRRQAEFAVRRYHDEVSFAASHLVGRESGFVLLGDHLVAEAGAEFREIVLFAYKMAVAFSHAYNVPPGDENALVNKALALTTLDDAADFVEELQDRARDYCGLEGIDCDAAYNISVVRLSLREHLFPQLHDIVDGATGKVVTAGEQFHNLIQQQPYLKRRIRGGMPVDQIELAVSLPLTVKETTPDGTPKWLIDPLSCNQLLAAGEWESVPPEVEGTTALNVLGQRLGDGSQSVHFELVRGPIDYQRACKSESVVKEFGTVPVSEWPIRTRLVGYAPQNPNGQVDSPPSLFIRSQPFASCINEEEVAGNMLGNCWRTFARDRSLASPDWKVVIPLYIDGAATDSRWITGEGLAEDERPIIEDIVMYFRYHTRPIEE